MAVLSSKFLKLLTHKIYSKMSENENKIKRSDLWYQIYNIINGLKLQHSNGDDCMDKPSCATELEHLFISMNKQKKKRSFPYFVFEKGKSVKKGRSFGYFKCNQFILISCYYFHIRICPSKKVESNW